MDEFVYCFRKIKLGHYGTDYNRLDILRVSMCLRDYMFSSERTQAKKEMEAEVRKEDNQDFSPPPKEYLELIENIENKSKAVKRGTLISIKGFAQSDFYKDLKEKIVDYEDSDLFKLRNEALEKKDHEALQIIDEETMKRI